MYINKIFNIFLNIPEKIRFLVIGAINTLFGIISFIVFYYLLQNFVHYLIILALNHILAVSFSFYTLRFLVFRVQDNVFHQFIRCHITYLVTLIINLISLYIFADYFKMNIILSQIAITLIIAIISYVGHKYFSFKEKY